MISPIFTLKKQKAESWRLNSSQVQAHLFQDKYIGTNYVRISEKTSIFNEIIRQRTWKLTNMNFL